MANTLPLVTLFGAVAAAVWIGGYRPAPAVEDDRHRSREAGFDAHMVKPVDHDVLLKLLSSLPVVGGAGSQQLLTDDVLGRS